MSDVLSAIRGAGALFAGFGQVTLGPLKLTGMMLPTSLQIGGRYGLDVHLLPGGGKVINGMGPADGPISWRGVLEDPDASAIARTLYKLYRSGTVLTLAWDVFSYQVIVEQFTCDTRFVPPMDYQISCQVVEAAAATGITAISMAAQLADDLANGNPVAALTAVSQGIVTAPIANAATAVGLPGATTLGSSVYNGAVSAVNSAASAIDQATTLANNTLAPLGISIGTIADAAPAALDTLGFASQIGAAADACGDLANLSSAAGFIGRAQANLQNASA